jgi:alkylation response protein AidB-like acyl-CoA dehydrogenase
VIICSPELRPVVDDVLAPHFGAETDPTLLWSTVSGLEWPLVGVAESAGGAGGDLADAAELAAGAGRHAVGLPLVETGLAAWVLAEAGLPVDRAAAGATVAVGRPGELEIRSTPDGWELDGAVMGVRWLPAVPAVVVVVPQEGVTRVVVLDRSAARVDQTENLAGEPVGTLRLDRVQVPAAATATGPGTLAPGTLAAAVVDRAALLRAAAIGGAIERACRLTIQHVGTRRQFGRPLIALQAVAHAVADIAVERDLVGAAVAAALARPGRGTAAAARATAARSAGIVAEKAHQLHGAMGITREHSLHLVTRRLWAWRDEQGGQRHWELLVGDEVLAGDDDDALWSLVTGRVA